MPINLQNIEWDDDGELAPDDIEWEDSKKPPLTINRIGGAVVEGAKDVARSTASGIAALLEQGLPEYARAGLEAVVPPLRAIPRSLPTEELAQPVKELSVSEALKTAPEYEGKSSGWIEDFSRGAPQMVGQIGATLAAGPLAGMGMMGLQITGDTYENAVKQGKDPKNALAWGVANAIVQSPLEQIGVNKISKLWQPQKDLIKKLKEIGEAAGTEWLTEFLQQFPDSMANIFAANPDKTTIQNLNKFADEFWTNVKEGAYQGTLTAPFALLGVGGMRKGKSQPAPEQIGPALLQKIQTDLSSGTLSLEEALKLRSDPRVDQMGIGDDLNKIIVDHQAKQSLTRAISAQPGAERGAVVANELIPALTATRSMGGMVDVEGPKYISVRKRKEQGIPATLPSEEVPATETPDMGLPEQATEAEEATVEEPESRFEQLIKPTAKGGYFNLNPDTGQFAFLSPFEAPPAGRGVDARYGAKPVTGNIADLESNFAKLPPEIKKAYGKWRDAFAKANPDKYNQLINQQPTVNPEDVEWEPTVKESLKVEPAAGEEKATPEKYRKIIEKLSEGKYKGKIHGASYGNVGIRPFDIQKLAGDLEVSADDLKRLIPIRITEQAGWDLPTEPTVEELKKGLPRIIEFHKSELLKALRSSRISPSQYNKRYAKDYGPLEKFAPEVVKPAPLPTKQEKGKEPGELSLTEFEKEHSPYEITQKQWVDMQRAERKRLGQSEESGPKAAPFSDYEEYHKQSVKTALEYGIPVSKKVLADYPDLTPKSEKKPTEPVDLLKSITSLQRPGQPRELVSISELRDKANMPPEAFDKALDELSQQGKVALHHHDFPSSLTPEKRSKLLKIGDTYYVGVVPKVETIPTKPETIKPKGETKAEAATPKVAGVTPGRAWIGGQFRPITKARDITRGKHKGKVEVFAGGRRYVVDKESVKEWPGTGEKAPVSEAERKVEKPKKESWQLMFGDFIGEITEFPTGGRFQVMGPAHTIRMKEGGGAAKFFTSRESAQKWAEKHYQRIVKQAVKEGKEVPKEVLDQFEEFKAVEPVAEKVELKEPWQMKRKEFLDYSYKNEKEFESWAKKNNIPPGKRDHTSILKWAMKNNKPVPEDVYRESIGATKEAELVNVPENIEVKETPAKETEGEVEDVSSLGTSKPVPSFPNHPSVKAIEKHIAPMLSKLKGIPPVHVIENWGHLPGNIQKFYEEKGIKGTYSAVFIRYNNGQSAVYILADRMESLYKSGKSTWHELGHFALRKTLRTRDEYNSFLDDMFNSKFKIQIMNHAQERYKEFNLETPEGQRSAADEWWAKTVAEEDFAKGDTKLKVMWDKFVAIVRKFLNSAHIRISMTRAEIREMMRRSYREMEKAAPTGEGVEVSGAEAQKLQPSDVNTKEFKAWFKDSKVVDENGKPLVVYHGTVSEFNDFKKSPHGIHFGSNEKQAGARAYGKGGNIIPAYIRIENPIRMKDTGDTWPKRVERAKKGGHDGVVYLNRVEGMTPENASKVAKLRQLGVDVDAISDKEFLKQFPEAKDSYIIFGPTQAKSIFNRGTWSETVADISGEKQSRTLDDLIADLSKPDTSEVTKEVNKDSLDTFTKFMGFLKANKRGWRQQRPDTTWLDRIISVPLHHFEKVPSLNAMFQDGLKRTDDYYTLQDALLKRPDGQYSTTVSSDLQKKDKAAYQKYADYLNKKDMNADGHKVTHDKDADTYTVTYGKDTIGTFDTEEQAWSAARADELKRMAEAGFSKEAIDAVGSFRFSTDNGFRILMKNIRDIITKFEQLGLPLPEVAIKDQDGETLKVDLKVALAKMGDIRGYYFPRIRRPGQYMLTAEKEGENPVMEFFDLKGKYYPWAPMNNRQRQLERQGYKVKKDLSPKMPEDVFQMAGEVVAMQAMINQALDRMKTHGITLDEFGLKGEFRGKDFVITGPTTKKMNKVLKDKMGGRFYQSKGVEKEEWHFVNPGKTFEKRLATALAEEVDVIGEQMETLFAKTLAEQVANVIKGRGHRAHMIKRASVTGKDVWIGYEKDPSMALAQYARGIAAGEAKKTMALNMVRHFTGTDVSWQEYKAEKADLGEKADYEDYMAMVEEKRINPTKQPNAFKEAKIFMEDMLRNQEHIDRLMGTIKGVAVLKYLAGRISAPLVNLTALATSAPAAISGYGNVGISKSMASLIKAGRLYTQYKFRNKSVSSDTAKLFEDIESKGWHKAQYNREALSVLESRLGKYWNNLIEYSMAMFGASEQLNRVSTIAGAYFAIKDEMRKTGKPFDHDAVLEEAKKISDKAHGVYNKANIPMWARGGGIGGQIAKSFYIFKTFSHNYLLTMYDLGFNQKQAKSALYMAVSPMILAGTGALVGKQLITGIMKALGLGGDDPEEELYQWIYENAGEKAENIARFGLFGVPGVSLKGSLEIGIADIPTTVKDVLGAPGSLFADLYYGGKSIARGDVLKGVEKMSPNALGSMFRAYREGTEGLTTGTNAPLFYGKEQVVADTVDSIYRFLSFNPAKIASIREKQWKERQTEDKYRQMRTDLYAKFKRFYLKPSEKRSQAEYIDLLTEVKEYNERVKNSRIKGLPQITSKSIRMNINRAFKPSKKERLRETEEED